MARRAETRARARALQMLYAWEMQGRPAMETVAGGLPDDGGLKERDRARAERLASAVAGELPELDREIEAAAEHWRFERIGAVERNILRLGLHEILRAEVPVPVAIDEAVKLAHWFAGPKAPAFVNGVLDGLARRRGRL
ncbi:MAG: transcription antitermination factor NusB [Gemmatimonadetes bacterium]|nr:transcription antitermination factor NusB [Gemmatimonadota bacterium]